MVFPDFLRVDFAVQLIFQIKNLHRSTCRIFACKFVCHGKIVLEIIELFLNDFANVHLAFWISRFPINGAEQFNPKLLEGPENFMFLSPAEMK